MEIREKTLIIRPELAAPTHPGSPSWPTDQELKK